jgi:hypothetical protein
MACTHTNINCGCKDSFLTTPAPCPTPGGCPDPQPCSEVFDAQCIIYTGDDITCVDTTVVAQDTNVADALNDIVDFVCQQTTISTEIECNNVTIASPDTPIIEALENAVDLFCTALTIPADIDCNQDTVVEAGTLVGEAIADVVDYFCNSRPVGCCPTFAADIQPSLSLEWGLQVNLTNGTAPFTYQWSYAQNGDVGAFDDMRGILFNGSTTAQNVALTSGTKYYSAGDGTFEGSAGSTHIKVRVTDADGQIADAYYVATRFSPAQ